MSMPPANQLNCSCNAACDESIFDVSISMAQWPSRQYMNVMALNPINASLPYKYDPVNSCGGGLPASPVIFLIFNILESTSFRRLTIVPVTKVFVEHALLAGDDYVTRNLVELNVYVQTNSITYIVESQDYEGTILGS